VLMTTLDVPFLYGTYTVREPSLLNNHEFVRTSFLPSSFSDRRFFHWRRLVSAPAMIEAARATVARILVVFEVFRSRVRIRFVYLSKNVAMASSAAECRRVDCAAISTVQSLEAPQSA
jgi:hypothetical protein